MKRIYLTLLLILISGSYQAAFAIDVTVTARVAGCGDGILDTNEQCDGNPVAHNSCSNLGFSSGNLSCTNACNYDTSACLVNNNSNNGNTTGNSNNAATYSSFSMMDYLKNKKLFSLPDVTKLKLSKNSVIFEGITNPETEVFLSDNNNRIITKIKSDKKGKYFLSVSNLSRVNNIFTLTSGIESKRFIVNMYSDNIIKYNDVTLGSKIKFKINAIINEYEIRMNIDFTDFNCNAIL